MRYVFLTACRNESMTLRGFLDEFMEMTRSTGIAGNAVLYVVDDLSTDTSRTILEEYRDSHPGLALHVIPAPTNLGNQGAMFFGLKHIEVADDDVLITCDSDGEDDVSEIRSIIKLGADNPGSVVLVERGQRTEGAMFKLFFSTYKRIYRFLAGQRVVPNNFMLIPGRFLPAIRRSPLVGVHTAYGILKLKFPNVVTTRDRRPRYGGKSSQSLFMLVSHGLVGLMVFYEVVISKLFMLFFTLGALESLAVLAGLFAPVSAQRYVLWLALGIALGGALVIGALLAACLVFLFKLVVLHFTIQTGDERP